MNLNESGKRKPNTLIFLLFAIILFLITGLIYTNRIQKKSELTNKNHLHAVVDSIRSATIDSMQNIIQEIVTLPPVALGKVKPSIELYELILMFAPNETLEYNLYDWKTEANNPAINWLTNGVEIGDQDFYREGEVVVSINNKIIQCLGKNTYPCKWRILLSGPRGGYLSFNISSVLSRELEPVSIEELFKPFRFEARITGEKDYQKTYRIKFPHKKPLEMVVQWSCGSAGCSLSLKCNTYLL